MGAGSTQGALARPPLRLYSKFSPGKAGVAPQLHLRWGLRQAPEEPRAGLCRARLPPCGCLARQEAVLALIKQVPLLLGACFNQGRTAGGVISGACAWAHRVAVARGRRCPSLRGHQVALHVHMCVY